MQSKIINYCKNNDLHGLTLYLGSSSSSGSDSESEDINKTDIWGRTAIFYAIRRKNIKIIKLLYDHGADIFIKNKISGDREDTMVTAFKTASLECATYVAGLFSASSCSYISMNINNYLPYLFRGSAALLTVFIKSFKIRSLKGYESVFCRNGKRCHYDVLMKYNVCFDLQEALKYSLVYGRYSIFLNLITLIRYDEQLDHVYRGPHGSQQTLLSLCASNGYYNGLRNLISYGANIHIPSVNERGETRNNLMATVDNRRYNKLNDRSKVVVKKCIHYLTGLYHIDEQNSRGQTALMFAQRAGNQELVDMLLDLGADPTVTDMDGNTYLESADETIDYNDCGSL